MTNPAPDDRARLERQIAELTDRAEIGNPRLPPRRVPGRPPSEAVVDVGGPVHAEPNAAPGDRPDHGARRGGHCPPGP
jgi:hypothetical protein